MNMTTSFGDDVRREIDALIETLHSVEQRLEHLTSGEVDTVTNSVGRTFLMQRAQERLRINEAVKQAAILNALPAKIALLDDEGCIVSINRRWNEADDGDPYFSPLCGVGANYLEICDRAADKSLDAERVAAGIRSVLEGQCATFSLEYACDSPSEPQWFLLTVTPMAQDERKGAIVMRSDVSTRARAENATRRTSELLQAVMDGAPDAIYVKDVKGRYLLCNAVVARFAGCRIDEMVGRDASEIFGPDDARAVEATDRVVFESGEAHSRELLLTSNGNQRRLHIHKVPFRNDAGEVIGLIGIARDVTAGHKLSADLAAEHARLIAVQNVGKIGSWSLDFSTGIYEWSEQTHRICETDPKHFVPTLESVRSTIHPDDRAAVLAATANSLTVPAPSYTIEHRLALHSGVERIVEQRWQVFRDSAGVALTALGTCQDITERRLAERELRENQSLLSMSGRLAHVGAWSVDLPPTRVRWSDTVALMHEAPPGTMPTIDEAIAYYAPEHMQAMRTAFDRCVESGEPFDVEYEIIVDSGRRVLVRAIGEAVRDDNGTIRRVQGALQDLTERRQAELKAERLADRLASTLETISDGFFILDSEWRYTYLNKEAERALQKASAEVIGRVIWEVVPEVIGTVFEEQYRRAMAGAHGLRFEALYGPSNIWFDVNCYPSAEGLSVYFRDVTLSRAARQRLELLEASVSQLNEIVLITKITDHHPPQGHVVFVNEAFVRSTGFSQADILGKSPSIQDGPRTDREELKRMRAALSRLESVHAQLVKYRKDGSWYWAEIEITPVGFADEAHSHFVMVERDVSERKRDQDALRELNVDLEARVETRTAELNLARIQAEEANRTKSSFLATMSHEIRTPMNGVIGMIDVLEQTNLKSGQVEIVKTVRESAHALLRIVDDVLDFSKIEAGQFQIDHEPMNIEAVLEGVCDTLDHVAAASGVTLQLFCDPAIPSSVIGDAVRLRQVLMNLVGNAVKFSGGSNKAGRVRLQVTLQEQDAEQAVVEFQVSDNGIGMDEAMQARLFTPFTQAEGGATRRFGGTGLGLSISQRLTALMGGSITVQSELQRGSTFVLRLTLRKASDAQPLPVPAGIDGLPCLVFGGNDSAAEDLMVYLESAGAQAQRVTNAAEVAPWFERHANGPCVVIVVRAGDATQRMLSGCRRICAPWPSLRLRFVVIEHGRHHDRSLQAADVRCLPGEAMHRAAFLHAVAQVEAPIPVEANPAWAIDTMPMPDDSSHKGLILVAEDNEINQKVIRKQLALLGFAADIASTGSEALDFLKRNSYDILLTDLHMPVMDGYELTKKVREGEAGRWRMPIVALTANAVKGEAKRCRDVGMDDYMTKPVQLANLRTLLGKWVPAITSNESAHDANAPPDTARGQPEAPNVLANLDMLVALVGDDPHVIEDMLAAFRRSAVRASGEINRALIDNDAGAAADAAHMLKSGARSIGAQRLCDVCTAIEEAAERGQTDALRTLQPRFETEMDALDRFLDEVQANGPGTLLAPLNFKPSLDA